MQKMKWKILADFDMESSDSETKETSFNFTIENARKYQISGSCIADGQKWVHSTKIQSVAAAKSRKTPCQIKWFYQKICIQWKPRICMISFDDAICSSWLT